MIAFSPMVTPPRMVAPEPSESAALDERALTVPVRFGLQIPISISRPWRPVIDKCDAVSDEDFRLDVKPFTEKVWLDILHRGRILAPF
jgi:hypothetical protein